MAGPIADAEPAGEPSRHAMLSRQLGVAFGAGLAAAATAVVFVTGEHPVEAHLGRPLIWAAAAFGPIVSLVVTIGALANHRFFATEDIDAAAGGPPSYWARMAQAVLQNTLEQTVLALAVYALLAILLPVEKLGLPWSMAGAFILGRAAFAIGYRHGAAGRAFGFGLTFYPTAVGLIYSAILVWRALA